MEPPANETSRVDPEVVTQATLGQTDTVAAVAAAFMGTSGGLGAGRLSLVGSSHCYDVGFDPGVILHPTRLYLPSAFGGVAGCIVGNICVILALASIHAVFDVCVQRSSALLRTSRIPLPPSYAVFAFLILYQGFASCGAALILRGPSVMYVLFGIASLVLSLAFPFAVHRVVFYLASEGLVVYANDAETSPRAAWFIGRSEWVPGKGSRDLYRFGCLFVRFTEGNASFLAVECMALLIMASLSPITVEDHTACGHKHAAMAAAAALHAGLYLFYQPCRCVHSNATEALFSAAIAAGLGGGAAGHYRNDPGAWGFEFGSVCFFVAGVTLMVRTLLDVGALLYVVATKRSGRLADRVADGAPDDSESTGSKPILEDPVPHPKEVDNAEMAGQNSESPLNPLVSCYRADSTTQANSTPVQSPFSRSTIDESPLFGSTFVPAGSGSFSVANGGTPTEPLRNTSFGRPRLPASRQHTLSRSHRPSFIRVASLARMEADPISPPTRSTRTPRDHRENPGLDVSYRSTLLPPPSPFSGRSSSSLSAPNTPHDAPSKGRSRNPLHRRLPPLV
ncbi:hypothetical protein DIPPA_22622 [Diplonema papillatum]|nr:hypothetical protein DIPPA_22622 [Diplonema papillatum]